MSRNHNPDGPNHILNRVKPCNCGCMGADSQHKQRFFRKVSNVVIFDEPKLKPTTAFGTDWAVAQGEVQLNGKKQTVYYVFGILFDSGGGGDNRNFQLGWCRSN